jgi:hypothetical protein
MPQGGGSFVAPSKMDLEAETKLFYSLLMIKANKLVFFFLLLAFAPLSKSCSLPDWSNLQVLPLQ